MRISRALGTAAAVTAALGGLTAPALANAKTSKKPKPKTTYKVTGGTVTATFSSTSATVLGALGIKVSVSAPTTQPTPTEIVFPLKSGTVNTKTGAATLNAAPGGSVVYSKGTTSLTVTNASVALGKGPVLNAALDGKSGPFLTLSSGALKVKGGKATVSSLQAKLSPIAAEAFDDIFSTVLLSPNLTVATVSIDAKVK
ncbi:MAG TPA: hypothetical protein VHX88_02390 [Solirubrobacteraceae bacterium]|jgi:hypothetical protein|nr:hypothetical protein [Solirubrobacteraceae bacterium]